MRTVTESVIGQGGPGCGSGCGHPSTSPMDSTVMHDGVLRACRLLLPPHVSCAAAAVLRGMGTVYKVEQLGSSTGKMKGKAVITDSGELPMHWRPKSAAPEPPGPDPYSEGDDVESG